VATLWNGCPKQITKVVIMCWWSDLITHLKGSNIWRTGGMKTGKGKRSVWWKNCLMPFHSPPHGPIWKRTLATETKKLHLTTWAMAIPASMCQPIFTLLLEFERQCNFMSEHINIILSGYYKLICIWDILYTYDYFLLCNFLKQTIIL
jgi:hypothetical protein